MTMKGLVISQPWIGMILRGDKTWEMRPKPCRHRGPIALIAKGSGTIVGLAEVVDDLPPLSETDLRSTFDQHRIPPEEIGEALRRGWTRPWILANVSRLQQPVPYKHTSGGSWVNLSAHEEASALEKGNTVSQSSAARYDTASSITTEHSVVAHHVLRRVSQAAQVHIPAEASTSLRRRGSKLYIDVEWDDARLSQPREWPEWAQATGKFAALAAVMCLLGFIIHFWLGVLSSSVSALSAFKWLVPMFVSSLIAMAMGQGKLLEDAFGKR